MDFIAQHLLSTREYQLKDFVLVNPSGLEELYRFMSAELHFILLHAGSVIFLSVLSTETYIHSLLFHISTSLLSDEQLYRAGGDIRYREELLKNTSTAYFMSCKGPILCHIKFTISSIYRTESKHMCSNHVFKWPYLLHIEIDFLLLADLLKIIT